MYSFYFLGWGWTLRGSLKDSEMTAELERTLFLPGIVVSCLVAFPMHSYHPQDRKNS